MQKAFTDDQFVSKTETKNINIFTDEIFVRKCEFCLKKNIFFSRRNFRRRASKMDSLLPTIVSSEKAVLIRFFFLLYKFLNRKTLSCCKKATTWYHTIIKYFLSFENKLFIVSQNFIKMCVIAHGFLNFFIYKNLNLEFLFFCIASYLKAQ
jgi:hypothetical protein